MSSTSQSFGPKGPATEGGSAMTLRWYPWPPTAKMVEMSARAVRRIVVTVFVLGIAGMIAGSIADNNGAALTAGLVSAAASLCLLVATAVANAPDRPVETGSSRPD